MAEHLLALTDNEIKVLCLVFVVAYLAVLVVISGRADG